MPARKSAAIRVMPAVIAVSIGALAFKGVDIYEAVAQAVVEGQGAPQPETALTAGVGDHPAATTQGAGPATPGASARADQCLPSLDYASETGISEQEILVLRSLADRRRVLDEREAGIETREQTAAAAEARLQEQIAELKKVESSVQTLLAAMETKRDERIGGLVKTYEAMKPKDAARIFDGMDDKLLMDLAKTMKPANLAAIMSLMQPKRAEALTRMLSELAKPPTTLESLANLPQTPT
jgi:flagellar motility protein MotE (MotC chaperone)